MREFDSPTGYSFGGFMFSDYAANYSEYVARKNSQIVRLVRDVLDRPIGPVDKLDILKQKLEETDAEFNQRDKSGAFYYGSD
jgi:hypothetical protein